MPRYDDLLPSLHPAPEVNVEEIILENYRQLARTFCVPEYMILGQYRSGILREIDSLRADNTE